MKKLMMLILALMLCVSAFAETTGVIPVEIVAPVAGQLSLEAAIARAKAALSVQPKQAQTRAELARMSDGSFRWVVTVFDLTNLCDGWCLELDAVSGDVVASYTTSDGFFQEALEKWAAAIADKGTIIALWQLEEKALFDTLYAIQPVYGLPQPGDLSREEAVEKAMLALANDTADDPTGYLICPGYLMGSDGMNGIWEICFAANGQIMYCVQLDAVSGEIYGIVTDEEGNG